MKKYLMLVLGVFLMFGSLWAGSYLMSIYTFDDWQKFPTFFTSFFLFVIGWLVIIYSHEGKA